MIRIALLYSLLVAVGFGAVAAACYATTGPVPSCADDPTQPGCLSPVHDRRADGGAR